VTEDGVSVRREAGDATATGGGMGVCLAGRRGLRRVDDTHLVARFHLVCSDVRKWQDIHSAKRPTNDSV